MPSQAPVAPNAPFQHVDNHWDDQAMAGKSPVEQLALRSNWLGQDQRVTNTGGGNTSSKAMEKDPITGQPVEVLWVKGSGGDLRTSKVENFASFEQAKLIALQSVYAAMPNNGPGTAAEDAMVELAAHCTHNRNPRPGSIDTPLHAFLPGKEVDHTHPNAIIALAACKNGQAIAKQWFGDNVGWVPWLRPGFELGLLMQQTVANASENLSALIMGQHGLISWTDDAKSCYLQTLSLIETAAEKLAECDLGEQAFGGAQCQSLSEDARDAMWAELLPWLRGQVSQNQRFIGTVQSDEATLQFVNSVDAPRLAELGTSCPDHFLRTKIKPLHVAWNPQTEDIDTLKTKLTQGLEQYRADYAAYYDACKRPDSPAMRDPNPTVVLIPGLGMVAWGKSKSESRVTAEFYTCAIAVMRGAEAVDEYIALPRQEAFDIEYWALEEAKLQRMPKEKPLARRVVAVIGAGSGIGQAVAHLLAEEGAHVVCADLDPDAAQATAQALTQQHGQGIGVAGTGISNCGPAIASAVNITDRDSIQAMLKQATLAYGGLDHIVITAGVFIPPDREGNLTDRQWQMTFDVNVRGSYQMIDEAKALFKDQNLNGSVVLTSSVNAVVAKHGSVAYDTSKAAVHHLVRELAIELSPLMRVNGVAPATVVKGSTMFPRDRVIASLIKYDIAFEETETDDQLRDKLARFYAQRTLTQSPITPKDQAEAIYFLLSERAARTTGQIINVDGGLKDAFLR